MIVDFRRLQRASGLKQAAAIRRWLKGQGIAFMSDAAGKPLTTLDAMNRALQSPRKGPDWSKPCAPQKSTRNTGGTTTSTRIAGIPSRA